MKRLEKTIVLGMALSLSALSLVACTNTSKDQGASNGASVEASATASTQAIEVKEPSTAASVEASAETSEAKEPSTAATVEATTQASEGVSFTKTEKGSGSENAIDSATVAVSVGEPYDNDPVPVPTDPTTKAE